jgi:hypothetical protein
MFTSVVFANSNPPESNTTNNQGSAEVQIRRPASALNVRVSAPAAGAVGAVC